MKLTTMKVHVACLAALAAFSHVTAAQPPSQAVPGAYILELKDETDVGSFIDEVQAKTSVRIRRRMEHALYKGVSLDLDDADKKKDLAAMPAVRRMRPVEQMKIDGRVGERQDAQAVGNTAQVKRQLERRFIANDTAKSQNTHHMMMQIDRLHERNLTGRGSRIALIDTGVDYTHPALGGCFGPGCRVSFGADLVYNEPTPMDCNGHGTIVAGLIIAQPNEFNIRGAAPEADLGMYRVTCTGEFPNDIWIDAIFRAHADGATMISSSSGNPAGSFSGDMLSEAAQRLVDAGVTFVQGAGNDGGGGVFTTLDPGPAPGLITVGSVNNKVTFEFVPEATYSVNGGPETRFLYWDAFPAANFSSTPMELYVLDVEPKSDDGKGDGGKGDGGKGDGGKGDDGKSDDGKGNGTANANNCPTIPDDTPDLSDKMVLIPLCKSYRPLLAAIAAKGAKYALADKLPNDGPPTQIFFDAPPGLVAFAQLDADTGAALRTAYTTNPPVRVTISPPKAAPEHLIETPDPRHAGAMTGFSSWGPTWDLVLKPSLTAVGSMVLSTGRINYTDLGFTIDQGTSIATPLVASVVALITEARGRLPPAEMQSLLVSYANPQLYYKDEAFTSLLAPVAQQGGGLVRAFDAAYATTLLECESAGLNFNDSEHAVASRDFAIKNVGDAEITYKVSHVAAMTVYTFLPNGSIAVNPQQLETVSAAASLEFDSNDIQEHDAASINSLTIPCGKSATIRVTATPPSEIDAKRLALWSGWITINGSDSSSLSLPYQGLSGSIREHRVLSPDGARLLYHEEPLNTSEIRLPAQGCGQPTALALLVDASLGSPLVHADVVPTSPGNAASIGQLSRFPVKYLPAGRVPTEGLEAFNTFNWTGLLASDSYAPAGSYKIVVRALRIFGDPDQRGDWDVSETPEFTIVYDK